MDCWTDGLTPDRVTLCTRFEALAPFDGADGACGARQNMMICTLLPPAGQRCLPQVHRVARGGSHG